MAAAEEVVAAVEVAEVAAGVAAAAVAPCFVFMYSEAKLVGTRGLAGAAGAFEPAAGAEVAELPEVAAAEEVAAVAEVAAAPATFPPLEVAELLPVGDLSEEAGPVGAAGSATGLAGVAGLVLGFSTGPVAPAFCLPSLLRLVAAPSFRVVAEPS